MKKYKSILVLIPFLGALIHLFYMFLKCIKNRDISKWNKSGLAFTIGFLAAMFTYSCFAITIGFLNLDITKYIYLIYVMLFVSASVVNLFYFKVFNKLVNGNE